MYYHCIGCVMMKVSQCDILEFIAFDHIDCGMEDKDFFCLDTEGFKCT